MSVSRATARTGLYCKAPRAYNQHVRAAFATAPCKQVAAPRGHYP